MTIAPAQTLAERAVQALVDEAILTPKPALVDRRGGGAHDDLTLDLLLRSARALLPAFEALERAACGRDVDAGLRAELGALGREGEARMLEATGGVNAHRGAIWALGLLVCGAALSGSRDPHTIALTAARIARIPDAQAAGAARNGARARTAFGVGGALAQAQQGFPHVVGVALPMLRRSRAYARNDVVARLDALVAVMSSLDDTCLLHRGGAPALVAARRGARAVLDAGGVATEAGMEALARLDRALLARRASPGGAADLLAAAMFLDACERG